jgi:hypothetical protein
MGRIIPQRVFMYISTKFIKFFFHHGLIFLGGRPRIQKRQVFVRNKLLAVVFIKIKSKYARIFDEGNFIIEIALGLWLEERLRDYFQYVNNVQRYL